MDRDNRLRSESDFRDFIPVHVVWEITLACDLKCIHCGSRTGARRERELSTAECFDVIDRLARMGTREITLIGGEAYLRADWTALVRRIRDHGILCYIQTGGRNLTSRRLAEAREAGLCGVGVSVDGLRDLHDELRGVPGSFDRALDSLRRAHAMGFATSVNTQIGARTMRDLPELMHTLIDAGATRWQVQLTVAMGNAVEHAEELLQPYQLLELMPILAELYVEGLGRNMLMTVGNNIGYFGPFEHLWRGFGDERIHFGGCSAGQTTMGLEADGAVKGCPSLATQGYTGGNVRDRPLEEIWDTAPEIHFARLRSEKDLWGFCATCYYADVCRAGCTWTADSLFGRGGNNPYCHYRARQLESRGLRERVLKKSPAPPLPFAIGEFELVLEPIPGRAVSDPPPEVTYQPAERLVPVNRLVRGRPSPPRGEGRVAPQLALCRGCHEYIYPHETVCPHCGAQIAEAELHYQEAARRRAQVMTDLRVLLDEIQAARPPG